MLTPELIQKMNQATGLNAPTDPTAPPTRASQIRALGKSASAPAKDTSTDPNMISYKGKPIVGGIVGGILKPVVNFGQSIGAGSQAPRNADLYAQNQAQHDEIANNLSKAIATKQSAGQDTTRLQTALDAHNADAPKLENFTGDVINKTNEQVIGEGVGTGLAMLSGGGLSAGKNVISAELAGKATLGNVLATGAKVGGAYGATGAVGSAMEQNKSAGDIAKEGLVGGAKGALTGMATAGVLHGAAQLPGAVKNVVNNRSLTSTANKTSKDTAKLTEMISPKMTAKETKLALSQGRIVSGKDPTMFRSGTADTVIPTDKVIKSTQTIQREIPNASKLKAPELHTALEARTGDMATKLKPEMIKTPVKPATVTKINKDWANVKAEQQGNIYIPSDVNVKKMQADFETKFVKSPSSNMDELWNKAIAYDSSVPTNIKKANSLSSESLQAKKEIWLQNRSVLRGAITDTQNGMGKEAGNAFSDMHDMYNAKENLMSKAEIQKAQPGKIVQWAKQHPYISTFGVGAAATATGIPGAAVHAVTGL